MKPEHPARVGPSRYVLSLSFTQAFGYTAAMVIAVLMYKSFGRSNGFLGTLGLLYVPFATVFLFAPLLDRASSKRRLTLVTGLMLTGALGALAAALCLRVRSGALLVALYLLAAVAGAIYDLSANGYFLHALDRQEQASYSGVRTGCTRAGQVFGGSILVKFFVDETGKDLTARWGLVFVCFALILFLTIVYHAIVLPRPPTDLPARPAQGNGGTYRAVLAEFLATPGLRLIVAFLLLYRFGEALLSRMTPSFLIDPPDRGGLGLSVGDSALMNGAVGMVFSIAGGLLGGWIIKQYGLRRVMFGFGLCMTVPHLAYLYLSVLQPLGAFTVHFGAHAFALNPSVLVCLGAELFGYGLGYAGCYYFAMLVAKGPYRASIFALCIGILSIGWLLPTVISGWLQMKLGYSWLFTVSMLSALPGIVLIRRLPIATLEQTPLD